MSGTVQVGSQLTATAGNWSGSPTSYAIGWLRCDSSGASCTTIGGQTNLTYLLTSADQGATIRAAITAGNANGSTTATSGPTAVVPGAVPAPPAGAAPSSSSQPLVSGTARVGSLLTATGGTWSGAPTGYAIQWRRCDSSGANCAAISGQTDLTYLLTSADQGATIRAAVTATNAYASSTALSAATATVQAVAAPAGAAPTSTSLPQLSGTAQVGSQLASTGGQWSGSPTSYAIQWRRCDSSGANCTTIANQTDLSYVLTGADQGATIRAAVTAANAYGSSTAVSAPTAVGQVAQSPTMQSIGNGSTVSGQVTWAVTPSGPAYGVWFYIDGALVDSDGHAPFVYGDSAGGLLNTSRLSNGTHVFRTDILLTSGVLVSSQVSATVSN